MSEATETLDPSEPKKKKKKDKVRSAWISFVGRIVAQVIGAVATIVFGVAFERAGDRARADALLQSLLGRRPLPAVPLSKWYALTDNKAAAYQTLERVLAEGMTLQQLKSDPAFDSMRGEARFIALMRRGTSTER